MRRDRHRAAAAYNPTDNSRNEGEGVEDGVEEVEWGGLRSISDMRAAAAAAAATAAATCGRE
jgi:hypothetical protein